MLEQNNEYWVYEMRCRNCLTRTEVAFSRKGDFTWLQFQQHIRDAYFPQELGFCTACKVTAVQDLIAISPPDPAREKR